MRELSFRALFGIVVLLLTDVRRCRNDHDWNECNGGFERPASTTLATFNIDSSTSLPIELRELEATLWVVHEIPLSTEAADFQFSMDEGFQAIWRYFHGLNLSNRSMPLTTPFLISINPWRIQKPTHCMTLIPKAFQKCPPVPLVPTFLSDSIAAVYYVRQLDFTTDFVEIHHQVALLMSDLTLKHRPFDGSEAILAFVGFPNYNFSLEIWIARTIPLDLISYEGPRILIEEETQIWKRRRNEFSNPLLLYKNHTNETLTEGV